MEGDLAVKKTAATDLKSKKHQMPTATGSSVYGSKENLASLRTGHDTNPGGRERETFTRILDASEMASSQI